MRQIGHLLALERQALMLAAFASLVVAGGVVSAGAWVLLWRSRRRPDGPGRPDGSASQ